MFSVYTQWTQSAPAQTKLIVGKLVSLSAHALRICEGKPAASALQMKSKHRE